MLSEQRSGVKKEFSSRMDASIGQIANDSAQTKAVVRAAAEEAVTLLRNVASYQLLS